MIQGKFSNVSNLATNQSNLVMQLGPLHWHYIFIVLADTVLYETHSRGIYQTQVLLEAGIPTAQVMENRGFVLKP